MMFLLKRGAKTSFSVPNWCRDCLTIESMTYKPGTLYSGLHCNKKKTKKQKNPIDIRGQRSSYYQTHDIFTENTLLEYYQVRLTSSTTHLLYELLYTLDDMFVELEEMKGKFFYFRCHL